MDSHHDPFDGDEEAALRYAIALSLQEAETSESHTTSKDLIEISSDGDEDDDLENGPCCPPTPKKSARSGNTCDNLAKDEVNTTKLPAAPQSVTQSAQPSGLSALRLDRKKMEEERLARVAKRKAPCDSTISESEHPARRAKLETQRQDMPVSPTLPYPKGVIKKTVSTRNESRDS